METTLPSAPATVLNEQRSCTLRITAVKTQVVNAQLRNWVFVKVETSDAGLYGWGECSLEWKTRSVVGAVEDFAPMILGEDPTALSIYIKKYTGNPFGAQVSLACPRSRVSSRRVGTFLERA